MYIVQRPSVSRTRLGLLPLFQATNLDGSLGSLLSPATRKPTPASKSREYHPAAGKRERRCLTAAFEPVGAREGLGWDASGPVESRQGL